MSQTLFNGTRDYINNKSVKQSSGNSLHYILMEERDMIGKCRNIIKCLMVLSAMKNNKLGKGTENGHMCDRGIWAEICPKKGNKSWNIWKKSVSDGGNRKCKGPEVRTWSGIHGKARKSEWEKQSEQRIEGEVTWVEMGGQITQVLEGHSWVLWILFWMSWEATGRFKAEK